MFVNKLTLAILGLGIALAPLVPSNAHAATAYSADEKQEALLFVSSQLQVLGSDDAALDYFIDAQEEILADEAEPSMVRDMAQSYRTNERFATAFTPTHKLFFEKGGIWHIVEMADDVVISHRCYLQNDTKVACN